MRKIIYTRPDGGISIVSMMEDTDTSLALAMARLPVNATNVQIIVDVDIPTDRTFRNAWRQDITGQIVIDLPLARTLAEKQINQQKYKQMRDLLIREALGEDVTLAKTQLQATDARIIVDTALTLESLTTELQKVR